MSEINIEFGNQLKQYREDRKLNQIEFGKILCYSQAEMSKIENGKIDITINQYIYIINTLEIYTYLNCIYSQIKFVVYLIIKHKIFK